MDPFYITIAICFLIALATILPFFTSSRRADAELNLKPLWQKRCGGKLGAIGVGVPALRVALYQEFMVVSFLGQTVIPYRDIQEVSIKRSFLSLNFSGVVLKLKGMYSGYRFHLNLRDSTDFVKIIESHSYIHLAKR